MLIKYCDGTHIHECQYYTAYLRPCDFGFVVCVFLCSCRRDTCPTCRAKIECVCNERHDDWLSCPGSHAHTVCVRARLLIVIAGRLTVKYIVEPWFSVYDSRVRLFFACVLDSPWINSVCFARDEHCELVHRWACRLTALYLLQSTIVCTWFSCTWFSKRFS